MMTTEPVVLINPFIVPEGKLDEAIAAWEAGRNFLKQQPGYLSTQLHQSLSADAKYALINVARWESSEHFQRAIALMQASGTFTPVEGLVYSPALYSIIRN